jgi:hypothetical protein
MWVVATYYGVWLATDSRLPAPVENGPEEHAILVAFKASDLGRAA